LLLPLFTGNFNIGTLFLYNLARDKMERKIMLLMLKCHTNYGFHDYLDSGRTI
jgi:hypothetical protein